MGDSGSGSWVKREIDDDEAEKYMQFLRSRMTITNEVRLSGGLSGADVRKIIVVGAINDKFLGQYILKICLNDDAEKELIWHDVARKSGLRAHVPDCDGVIPHNHLSGIFYRVAGHDISSTSPLASHYEERANFSVPLRLKGIAATILAHNLASINNPAAKESLLRLPKPELSSQDPMFPNTLIAQIRYWLEDYRLVELNTILDEILYNPQAWQIMFSNPLDAVWRLNPFPFVYQPAIIPEDGDVEGRPPEGLLHGDLHPGNLILPADPTTSTDWYLIDFAAGRKGNAFFDLAFLEHSIMLSIIGGLSGTKRLPSWWEAERRLHEWILPQQRSGQIDHFIVQNVLPIRSALRQKARNFEEEYFNAYLLASVEAGLRLTRILKHDEQRRLIAFLTAVSRFHHLVFHRLHIGARYEIRTSSTNVKWRAESSGTQGTGNASVRNRYPVRPWPQEAWEQEELYDPKDIVTDDLIAGLRNPTGIALIGERRSGKSSFVNVMQSRLKRKNGAIQFCRVPTLGIKYTASQFAGAIWQNILAQVDAKPANGGLAINARGQVECDDPTELPVLVATACTSALSHHASSKPILLLDEFDGVLNLAKSNSIEDARLIVEIVSRVVNSSPLSLCLTASDENVIRMCSKSGDELLDSLTTRSVPMWSDKQIHEFVQHLDLGPGAQVHFSDEAISRICDYSGWQISVAKLVGLAVKEHPKVTLGERYISSEMIDESMRAVAYPERYAKFQGAADLRYQAWHAWKLILQDHFGKDERTVAHQLAFAEDGILEIDGTATPHLLQGAESLTLRGYLTRVTTDNSAPRRTYKWRIGFWQLLLEGEVGSRTPARNTFDVARQSTNGSTEGPSAPPTNGYQARLYEQSIYLNNATVRLTSPEAEVLRVALAHGQAPTFSEIADLIKSTDWKPTQASIKKYLEIVKNKLEKYPSGKGVIEIEGDCVIFGDITL